MCLKWEKLTILHYFALFVWCRLLVLQEVLGKSLERINMNFVFLEDSDHSSSPVAPPTTPPPPEHHLLYHNTTAYVFTWLLIIQAMSQCDPEVCNVLSMP